LLDDGSDLLQPRIISALLLVITSRIFLKSYHGWQCLLERDLILLALDMLKRFSDLKNLFIQAIQSLINFLIQVHLLLFDSRLSFHFCFVFFPLLDDGHLQSLLYRQVVVFDLIFEFGDYLLQCLHFGLVHFC
jgi:hypothetical protein